ncbi:MAG: HAD family hydrolase [Lachnospiraceae bacterium]|nr:HAD family hydrolase [Lachnospiraceae bacterium]
MITTVMFDMGGTLEDIYVDDASEEAAIRRLDEMLKENGIDLKTDLKTLKESVDAGWDRYGVFRDRTDIELKPVQIWCDYVMTDFDIPKEKLAPLCEEIAHMWEVTHFHRRLRPRVAEMLEGLQGLGMKLGVISNTAAQLQVFDTLEEYGIRGYFQDVTLSAAVCARKPAGDIFTISMRQLRSKPEECVYVGDTISRDIIGSKRAGFAAAIQIGSKLTRMKDAGIVREYEPDYFVEDIYEVLPIVKDLVGSRMVTPEPLRSRRIPARQGWG